VRVGLPLAAVGISDKVSAYALASHQTVAVRRDVTLPELGGGTIVLTTPPMPSVPRRSIATFGWSITASTTTPIVGSAITSAHSAP
jgi:hypothetical protein